MVIHNQKVDYLYLPKGTILNDKYLVKDKLVPKSNLSIVYLAVNSITGEKVIVKEFFPQELVLRDLDGIKVVPKYSNQKSLKKEVSFFLQEAKIMKQIKSPGVACCYDYFKANNTGYIVLKYYQGANLKDYFKQQQLDLRKFLLQVFYPLLKTVASIHEQNYIHRDLKPTNIIYTDKPILIDFGSAVQYTTTENKRRVLTPGYSPLEFHSEESKQGPSSDVYSLAAILYYYFTFQPPLAVKERIIEDSLLPVSEFNPWVSQGLNDFIIRNLSLESKYRDQSIAEFRLNLRLEYLKIKSKKILKSFFSNLFS
ncbi:serine/threonine protein kinase [Halanaerobacter jeridensis]|uniref:Serine/threonine protein kinase n=1 Tax=Halanaerobacter jeridensis TaxID=706427 RepID=A0A938XQQ9_9FIRM|nr:serine/threonine-protein kinase [Halanaerobacter jeridensis]MBM7555625.1 serine/threonine protein kinase [Halanaerobacter jeridensis]